MKVCNLITDLRSYYHILAHRVFQRENHAPVEVSLTVQRTIMNISELHVFVGMHPPVLNNRNAVESWILCYKIYLGKDLSFNCIKAKH